MGRKIIVMILTGIISVLLIAGCSSQDEGRSGSNTDTTEQQAQETEGETVAILPSDAKIGIVYAQKEGEFTSLFIQKTVGNLISAGVVEDHIKAEGCSLEELEQTAADVLSRGCSVLVVGNADADHAPAITDAAVKAGTPVLYFGTNPGEKEIARWQEKGLKAAYVGSTCEESAAKRADLITSTDREKIDLNGDEEIGMVILRSGNDLAGDKVNESTVRILEESEAPVYDLTQDEEEEPYEGIDRESAANQVESWMSDYGERLELILCASDAQALGAWDAVSDQKKKVGHDVLIMGFDADTESLEQVAAGHIRSTFFNDFMEQSQNASSAVLAFLKGNGGSVQPSVTSEYVSATVDNAQELLDIAQKVLQSAGDREQNADDAETEENGAEE